MNNKDDEKMWELKVNSGDAEKKYSERRAARSRLERSVETRGGAEGRGDGALKI